MKIKKIKCKKCGTENNFELIIDPNDFTPCKFFQCWYCKQKQRMNAETGRYTLIYEG